MFTGIVGAVGTVTAVETAGTTARISIDAHEFENGLSLGESIAVDGVCLTVAEIAGACWTADAMRVTLETTTLSGLVPGGRVNLERAVRADGRLGGHIVQGHVDGVATLESRDSAPDWDDLTFRVPDALARYVVAKGSIALNGVSLTVAKKEGSLVTVSLIPTTLSGTTFGSIAVGDTVNVEVDILAKYVEGFVGQRT